MRVTDIEQGSLGALALGGIAIRWWRVLNEGKRISNNI
jgi:hypothetical protein